MKKVLSLILVALMSISLLGTAIAAEISFADVKATDWFYNDVKTAVDMGLVNGKSPTRFAPKDNLSYAEAFKLAACMNQLYSEGSVTLTNGNPWYKPYVDYCLEKGIANGIYAMVENKVNQPAVREAYMAIFAESLPDEALKEINNIPDNSIPDFPSEQSLSKYTYKLYRAGILNGVDKEHNCTPKANITRAEVAAVLTRMMDETKRVRFSMGAEEQKPEATEPEETEPEATEPEKTEPEATEPEKTETETKEPETTGTSSGGAKDKFQQVDSVELKKEDFTMTIDDWSHITSSDSLVLIGKVSAGKVNVGDTIYINDANGNYVTSTKVTRIAMFNKSIDEARKGDSPGIYIDLDATTWKAKLERGYVASATKGTVSVKRPSTVTRPTTKDEKVFYADLTAMVSSNDSGKIAFATDVFNGSGDYSYVWQRSSDGNDWDSSSYKTKSHEFDARTKSYNRCKITDNSTGEVIYTPAIAPKDVAKYGPFVDVTNDKITAAFVYATNIDTYDGKDAMYTGKEYEINVLVIGGTAPYTYEWSYGEKTSDDFKELGGSVSSMKIRPSDNLNKFKCIVTDANGNTVTSEIFNVITIINLSGN